MKPRARVATICRALWLSAVLGAGLMGGARADLGDDFENEEWKEQAAALPPFPKPEDLIQAQIGARYAFSFFIDQQSIDLGKDGVVRYTVVARSPAGAESISFEGIRCSTRESKVYAIGGTAKTWTQPRKLEWADISSRQSYPYRAILADRYFCPEHRPVTSKRSLIWDLKNGTGQGFNPEPTMRY